MEFNASTSGVNLTAKLEAKDMQLLKDNPGKVEEGLKTIVMRSLTLYLATEARQGLSDILSKPMLAGTSGISSMSVKATGKSANNLFVGELAESDLPAHIVYEGTDGANYYIRKGTPGGKRNMPPIQRIEEWIRIKGIIARPRPAPNVVYGSVRNFRRQVNLQDQLAWAIAMGIKKKGTSTAHKPLYPSGSRRFDYVGYAILKEKMITKIWEQAKAQQFPLLNNVLIGWLKSNGRAKADVIKKRGTPRIK